MSDPASGVGVLAAFGAAARAVATNRGVINDPFAEPLVRASGFDELVRAVDDERYATDDGENQMLASLMATLAEQTRISDEYLADAGRSGIRQVVILASGLDVRPYRLWWPRGTTVYEIDQPQVIDFKSRVLRGLGAELAANRRAIGIDLRDDWLEALLRVGFDTAAPTVWIAEQLLVGYLPPDRQHRLLQGVSSVSAVGSKFAADHMPVWTPVQLEADRALVDGWHELGLDVGLASLTHPGEYRYVPDYLAEQGWDTAPLKLPWVETERAGSRDRPFLPEYVTATRN